jgi:ribonuclease III
MINFNELENDLGIKFKNEDLLARAFCHRSYINENHNFKGNHNERLEFLGDAVLEIIVSDELFHNFPDKKEGFLTSLRAALVNSKMLYKVAKELDFSKFLLLSKGESKEKGKARREILANTMEAFIGALYLDQGLEPCRAFILKYLMNRVETIMENQEFIDAKSKFQEVAQEKEKITPRYEVLKEWGPDHSKTFIAGVFLGDNLIAKGEGRSKQEAEEDAAQKALKKNQ